MNQSLSYVIVTPYTVAKSRTGGILSRLLSSVDLELVGAQVIAADKHFASSYAAILREQSDPKNPDAAELLARYVENNIGPSGGRPHRSLFLLFRGENAYRKLSDICGALYPENRSVESITGETIRDTYSDLIYDEHNPKQVNYFEPAVFTPRDRQLADKVLTLLSQWLPSQPNIIENILYPDPSVVERTLVIIKPENWRYASSKPGTIIDMFSKTGLRIVGMKVHRMSVNEALEFYGQVDEALKKKLSPIMGEKALEVLQQEMGMKFSKTSLEALSSSFGVQWAHDQFEQIVEFMSGRSISTTPLDQRDAAGIAKSLIIVYEGVNACQKIREVLGPTDPSKAPEGTIRREFGTDVMINTAHASDSPQSAEREMRVTQVQHNRCAEIIATYLAQ